MFVLTFYLSVFLNRNSLSFLLVVSLKVKGF